MWTDVSCLLPFFSLLFLILSDSKLRDNPAVYPKANPFLLLGDAVAGWKCLDYGPFRNVNVGISHGRAAAPADGFLLSFRREKDEKPKAVG